MAKIIVEAEGIEELKAILWQLVGNAKTAGSSNGKTTERISELPIPVRIIGCLAAENVDTLEQLSKMSPSHLTKTPNLGPLSIANLCTILAGMLAARDEAHSFTPISDLVAFPDGTVENKDDAPPCGA